MLLYQVVVFISLIINFFVCAICTTQFPEEIQRGFVKDGKTLSKWELFLDFLVIERIRIQILQHFPRDDLFFIGQSLAYLGTETNIMRLQFGSNSGIVSQVPFSGSHMNIVTNSRQEYQFTRNPENYPTEEELTNYRIFLQRLRLDPQSIVERFETAGLRAIIIKDLGTGLVSILEILSSWARSSRILPDVLRNAVQVFAVVVNNGFPDISVITIGEYSFDLIRMDITSAVSSSTFGRIAYPERDTGYVRLVSYYPHQLWNRPPPEFDLDHGMRRITLTHRLWEEIHYMRTYSPQLLSILSEENFSFESDLRYMCQAAGPSWQGRFKRDLSSHDLTRKLVHFVLTSTEDVLKTLKVKYDQSLEEKSPWHFIEDQLKNSSSAVNKILTKSCDEYHRLTEENQLVRFIPSYGRIFSCIGRYRLFQCDEKYETIGLVRKIASSASAIFSGKNMTRKSVDSKVKDLIMDLIDSYTKFPVDYVIEVTKGAVLYCSQEKIESNLECPSNNIKFLGQIAIAWFHPSSQTNDNLGSNKK